MRIGPDSRSAPNSSSSRRTLSATGRSAPLGASVEEGDVNFNVYSSKATRVDPLLFDSEDAPPSQTIRLDPSVNALTTTGMYSYRDCSRDSSMDIALMGPSTHRKGCASMRPKCCWTRMGARWSFPSVTDETPPPARDMTMPRSQRKA
jgi:hypothetical protein